jgi:tetratricopeptide (TPR) repeat protein
MSMKQSWGWAALTAALLALAPLHAVRADETTDEVKSHLSKAKVHYDLGEFDDAAEEYIQAYRIKPIPGALYNIAQAYRQAGKYDKSRTFYRSYLREANPEGKVKATVEKQLKELDELVAKEDKARRSSPTNVQANTDDLAPPSGKKDPAVAKLAKQVPSPAAPSPDDFPPPQTAPTLAPVAPVTPAPKPPPAKVALVEQPKPAAKLAVPPIATLDQRVEARAPRSHTLSYVIGAAGLAVLGGGVFFGVQAARADNELTAGAHSRADADTLINTSKSDHLVSAVMLSVGAAAVIGAGVLYFLPASGPSGGQGVAVAGTF